LKTLYAILYLFVLYWFAVSFLSKRGVFERYNITAWGPVLMVRTSRGQKLLDYLARPKRFWRAFANLGVPMMFLGMFTMLLVVVLADYAFLLQLQSGAVPEPGELNQPRNILLIPGINEFIPFTWGLIGLVITLVVHEFSHAILCKVEGVRVKALGLLLAPFPIGGFAEPDEEQLMGDKGEPTDKKVASRGERTRILTAGVMSNFVTAFLAFSVFFATLGVIVPTGNNVIITGVEENSAAMKAGLHPEMIITHINGVKIDSASDVILELGKVEAGSTVRLQVIENGAARNITLPVERGDFESTGMIIGHVVEGSAAKHAGLREGMMIRQIDGVQILSFSDFVRFMSQTHSGQKISVEAFEGNHSEVFNITLGEHPRVEGRGFLGVSPQMDGGASFNGITLGEFPAGEYLRALRGIPSMLSSLSGWFIIFTLPIMGLGGEGFPGFSDLLTNFYEPVGWAESLGVGIFWIANAALWIGWINFYVGLFNCLPAVPLDGGHVFKDVLSSAFNRFLNEERSERMSRGIVAVFAVMIFSSFLLMIALPWIVHGF
jgi:membrane-associated protease RseP (regulator of RpoE activity)